MLSFVNWKNCRKKNQKMYNKIEEIERDRDRERNKDVQNFAWLIKESIVYRFMIRF